TKRCNHTATLLKDGKVLIAGGDDCSYSAIKLNTAEIYDPQTGLFTHVSDMKVVRSDHTASLLKDGRVLIVGGTRYYDNEKTTEIYDPQTGTFTPGPPTINKHANHTADMLPDGKVIIIGNGTEIYIP
ncbi:MAG: kelch-like protein, partial [Leptospiraceae bacterium]|nr:kelch-like protein [Leptospiraceae bacterium]